MPLPRFERLEDPRPGSVGRLVKARDRLSGLPVLVKLAPAGTEAGRHLAAEGVRLAGLRHRRIVSCVQWFLDVEAVNDLGRSDGLALGWIAGMELGVARLAAPLPIRLRWFAQVVEGVHHLHRSGLLHLDLKPSNILCAAGEAVIVDLGSATGADPGVERAGGTRGYAAPEVVARRPATVSADIYGLGALLTDLCVDSPEVPWSSRGFEAALERWSDQAPDGLADLARSMLAPDPGDRPPTVADVARRVGELGVEVNLGDPGDPPFVGRSDELGSLRVMLWEDATPIAVVGEKGSGRSRLAKKALDEFLDREGRRTLDLSGVDSPLRALARRLQPEPGQGRIDPDLAGLASRSGWRGRVFFGRRERLDQAEVAALDALTPALVSAGIGPVWASERCPPDARPFHLGGLDPAALHTLAVFAGAVGDAASRAASAMSSGLPGPFLRNLGLGPSRSVKLDPAAEDLRTLPAGVPASAVERLGAAHRRGLRQLVDAGQARHNLDGQLYVDGSGPKPIAAGLGPLARACLTDGLGSASWRAALACRLGDDAAAAALFDEVVEDPRTPRVHLEELCARLAAASHPSALARHVHHLFDDGAFETALPLLDDRSPIPLHERRNLRAYALHALGRVDEALQEALRAVDEGPRAEHLIQVACYRCERGEFELMEQALLAAEAVDPPAPPGEALGYRVAAALRRTDAGEQLDLEPLLAAVRALLPDELSYATLGRCARLEMHRGNPLHAATLYARATRDADRRHHLSAAGSLRVDHGNACIAAGRPRDAQRALSEALQIARALGRPRVGLRALFALAEIALRRNQVPEARRRIAEFARALEEAPVAGGEDRLWALRAATHELEGDWTEVLAALSHLSDQADADLRTEADLSRARALIELQRPAEALAVLDREAGGPASGPEPTGSGVARMKRAGLRGRCLIALGRAQLAQARATVPADLELELDLVENANILLWSAGEDLDPDGFAARRADLLTASRLLGSADSSRAACLRERMLSAPGAQLSGVIDLLEVSDDPLVFARTLARVVSEALGANRVLILVRIPGLGRQQSYTELSREEAAGIGTEVLRRIVRPDDVWLSEDAFADESLRNASNTVRTFAIRSVVAVAIPWEGEAIGALYVDDTIRTSRFTAVDVELLQRIARAAARMISLLSERRGSRALPRPVERYGVLLGHAEHIDRLDDVAEMLRANPHSNVLITGETGTGKTWLAERLATEALGLEGVLQLRVHQTDADRLVSSLGGTRTGYFTGAADREGLVQRCLAERKALLVDEVQALDDQAQVALLPLLELPLRHEPSLVGPARPIAAPFTVFLSTNVNTAAGQWRAHFREDLWFRMSRLHIHPPGPAGPGRGGRLPAPPPLPGFAGRAGARGRAGPCRPAGAGRAPLARQPATPHRGRRADRPSLRAARTGGPGGAHRQDPGRRRARDAAHQVGAPRSGLERAHRRAAGPRRAAGDL